MHHLDCKQPFSYGKPILVPSNHNNGAQGPCFNLGLDFVKKRTLTFWRPHWGLGKGEGRSSPFAKYSSMTKEQQRYQWPLSP